MSHAILATPADRADAGSPTSLEAAYRTTQRTARLRERGMATLLLTAALDDRAGPGVIASRIGISQPALSQASIAARDEFIRRALER